MIGFHSAPRHTTAQEHAPYAPAFPQCSLPIACLSDRPGSRLSWPKSLPFECISKPSFLPPFHISAPLISGQRTRTRASSGLSTRSDTPPTTPSSVVPPTAPQCPLSRPPPPLIMTCTSTPAPRCAPDPEAQRQRSAGIARRSSARRTRTSTLRRSPKSVVWKRLRVGRRAFTSRRSRSTLTTVSAHFTTMSRKR